MNFKILKLGFKLYIRSRENLGGEKITWERTFESHEGVDEADDGALDLAVAVAGHLEVSDDLLGVAVVPAAVRDKDDSGGEVHLKPSEEDIDAGFPVEDVIQGPAVLVESVVVLKENKRPCQDGNRLEVEKQNAAIHCTACYATSD